jgi:hypothetical protein
MSCRCKPANEIKLPPDVLRDEGRFFDAYVCTSCKTTSIRLKPHGEQEREEAQGRLC